MLNKRTLKLLKEKSIKDNVVFPKNYDEVLQKYYEIAKKFGYNLSFNFNKIFESKDELNANAGLPFKFFPILIFPEWTYRLICHFTEEIENAFLLTLGHEMTHKENDLFVFKHVGKNKKFFAYINEIHADFGGAKKLGNNNRENLIQALFYKKKNTDVNKNTKSHPSWDKRIEYATNYNFNEELIRKIASDVKVTDEKIINIACHHFDDIILK